MNGPDRIHTLGGSSMHPVSAKAYICPSSRCEEGAVVLGFLDAKGVVGYISPALPVNAEFAEHACRDGSLERRFRFAAACQEKGCQNWIEGRCGVIEDALLVAGNIQGLGERTESNLPRCSIRRSCRWFAQRGSDACRICPLLFNYVWSPQHDGGHE
jgi:hypothetical protein